VSAPGATAPQACRAAAVGPAPVAPTSPAPLPSPPPPAPAPSVRGPRGPYPSAAGDRPERSAGEGSGSPGPRSLRGGRRSCRVPPLHFFDEFQDGVDPPGILPENLLQALAGIGFAGRGEHAAGSFEEERFAFRTLDQGGFESCGGLVQLSFRGESFGLLQSPG